MKNNYLTLNIPENLAREWFRGVGAEIVVHCKDCEYWKHHSFALDHDYCELTSTECEEDHFCSWGEKKDER